MEKKSHSDERKFFNYKTIWISDLHLGTRGCQAELLLEFIKYNNSEKFSKK